jgi:putative hydrolase
MVAAAMELGHEYLVLTDHSPRLTVARGLSADRLREQLDVVAALNENLGALAAEGVAERPFRILTGIEVDILDDGSLDQEDDLLAGLDVVVGSVHSGLRDPAPTMTHRMVRAIENRNLDILGHCTGRMAAGGWASDDGTDDGDKRDRQPRGDRAHRRPRRRPESEFDADAVFAACVRFDKAIEINCRPERLDPPKRLLRRALEAGCRFAIDTDAHAPGQLDWLPNGCSRAVACGVEPDRVVNTWPADQLLAWARGHG